MRQRRSRAALAVLALGIAAFGASGADRAATAEASKPSAPSPASAEVTAQRQALRARVEALTRELAAREASRAEAADALRASEVAVSEARRRLFDLERERKDGQARLAALARDRDAARARIRDQQERLVRLLARQAQGGRYDAFKLILSGRHPDDVARLLFYYRVIGDARAHGIQALRDDQARLAALASAASEQQAKLDALATDEAKQQDALEREHASRAKVLAGVASDVQRQRRELATLRRDEARLSALLERLARLSRSLPPAKPPSGGPAAPTGRAASGFAARRGLSLPVRGELAGRFGSPRDGGGPPWKGWLIRCAPGQEVRAIAAGQVVFADWLRGFGNLLILDHGDGYMSLYGYNDALLAQVGVSVKEGEPIAQAGASGGSAQPGVYFEIRYQGQAVDPAPWMTTR